MGGGGLGPLVRKLTNRVYVQIVNVFRIAQAASEREFIKQRRRRCTRIFSR